MLALDPPQPLPQGYACSVRLGHACSYQGEPRRSGPRGRAVMLGVQLGPRSVALRRLHRTREVSLHPVRPLRCRRWQKRAFGGAGRRPAVFGRCRSILVLTPPPSLAAQASRSHIVRMLLSPAQASKLLLLPPVRVAPRVALLTPLRTLDSR